MTARTDNLMSLPLESGEAMHRFGFTGYRVLINNRKLLAGLARSAGAAPDQARTRSPPAR